MNHYSEILKDFYSKLQPIKKFSYEIASVMQL
jgi:hypothetical protein